MNGTDAQGKPTHNEWVGKFNGKEYPVTGDPNSDMRSYKQKDDHTLDITIMKDGKVTMTGKVVVSADGKTRTIKTHGTEALEKSSTTRGRTIGSNRSENLKLSEAGVPPIRSRAGGIVTRYDWLYLFRLTHE